MLQCPQVSSMTSKIKSIDTIIGLPSSILLTKDGYTPLKFTKKWSILQGVFWAGAVLGYELSAIPIISDSIDKTNAVLPDSYLTDFNCNQLDWNCWPKDYSDQCLIHKKNRRPNIVTKRKSTKSNELSRERLSRAFYLCDGSYDNFTFYKDKFQKKVYTWSAPLVDEWLVESKYNGFAKPVYFIGKRAKEIWVIVRGSYSLDDWLTDFSFTQSVMATGSYHKGFYQAASNLWPSVNKVIKEYQSQDYEIIFTGHSYGGAVANVLHKLASSCYKDLNDKFIGITFGSPPAMGKRTAADINNNVFSFINGNDPVPCMSSGNIKRFGKEILIALLTIFSSELDSQIIAFSMRGTFEVIHTDGFENDEPDRPIGKVYHMTWELWKDDMKKDLKTTSNTDFNEIANINCVFPHHSLGMYGRQFLAYKNGVMKPKEFDKDSTETEIKSDQSDIINQYSSGISYDFTF